MSGQTLQLVLALLIGVAATAGGFALLSWLSGTGGDGPS